MDRKKGLKHHKVTNIFCFFGKTLKSGEREEKKNFFAKWKGSQSYIGPHTKKKVQKQNLPRARPTISGLRPFCVQMRIRIPNHRVLEKKNDFFCLFFLFFKKNKKQFFSHFLQKLSEPQNTTNIYIITIKTDEIRHYRVFSIFLKKINN